MRHMSFFLTTNQVRCRTKTVTRRLGWDWLVSAVASGEQPLVQPVVKGQGLGKGGKVELINGPIRVIAADWERLHYITAEDVVKEGFPEMTAAEFVEMFCEHNKCQPDKEVNRI